MVSPDVWKDGFQDPQIAKDWILHIEESQEPLREQALYPYIFNWADRMGIGERIQVVDLCCGQGASSELLNRLGAIVTGVDYSKPLINRAQKLYAETPMEFIVGNVGNLGFLPENQFNAAMSINGLFHLPPSTMNGLFNGLARIVIPGGSILITSVNPDAYPEFAGAFRNQREIYFEPEPPFLKATSGIIGDPEIAGPDGGKVNLKDTPFVMHPPENIEVAAISAGLVLCQTSTLGSLELVGGPAKDLFIAHELTVG